MMVVVHTVIHHIIMTCNCVLCCVWVGGVDHTSGQQVVALQSQE
jgi:hypothetical protein